jgi:hypothetical protein
MIYYKAKSEDPEKAAELRKNQEAIWQRLIETFGKELVQRRGVVIDSFVHDYEWDDESKIWQFHEGFPDGFTRMRGLAEKYESNLGIWFSPFGGYPGRAERIEEGRKFGFETSPKPAESNRPEEGFTLAGPRYYSRFRQASVNMLRLYGTNYFKFDGFGNGNHQNGPGGFMSDVEALLTIIADLRSIKEDVFVNPSTGSWPSPFWLLHSDCIWRAGRDAGVFGKGSPRQKWITYRDNETLHSALERGPLYPLNAYMLHGIMINTGGRVQSFEEKDIIDEVRSFFGTGTNLQELYIEPSLMTERTWDVLAEAAIWSRRNSDVLVDTHWVGGDPSKYEIYGWASWNHRKGILTLRNPDEKAQSISLDIRQAFELPPGVPDRFTLNSPWQEDAAEPSVEVTAGRPHSFDLEPFEVIVLEAMPE